VGEGALKTVHRFLLEVKVTIKLRIQKFEIPWSVLLLIAVVGVLVASQYFINDMKRTGKILDGKAYVTLSQGLVVTKVQFQGGAVLYERYQTPLGEPGSYERLTIQEDSFAQFLLLGRQPEPEIYILDWQEALWKCISGDGYLCLESVPVRGIPVKYRKYLEMARQIIDGEVVPVDRPAVPYSSGDAVMASPLFCFNNY